MIDSASQHAAVSKAVRKEAPPIMGGASELGAAYRNPAGVQASAKVRLSAWSAVRAQSVIGVILPDRCQSIVKLWDLVATGPVLSSDT